MYKLLQQDDGDDNDGGSYDEGAGGDPRQWGGDAAFNGLGKESACGFGELDRVVLGDVLEGRCENAC